MLHIYHYQKDFKKFLTLARSQKILTGEKITKTTVVGFWLCNLMLTLIMTFYLDFEGFFKVKPIFLNGRNFKFEYDLDHYLEGRFTVKPIFLNGSLNFLPAIRRRENFFIGIWPQHLRSFQSQLELIIDNLYYQEQKSSEQGICSSIVTSILTTKSPQSQIKV